jgi:choline kinase
MKAVILAAGVSRRMGRLTDGVPKPLLPLGKSTLIETVLAGLSVTDVEEALIVLGHQSKRISDKIGSEHMGMPIRYVKNLKYREPSNIHSLLAVRKYITDGMIFTNADSIMESSLYKEMVDDKRDNIILVDNDQNYFNDDDPVKVNVDNDKRIRLIGKDLKTNVINGVAIGLYKFSQNASRDLFIAGNRVVKDPSVKEGYLLAVRELLDKYVIEPYYTRDKFWYDTDTPKDYSQILTKYGKK